MMMNILFQQRRWRVACGVALLVVGGVSSVSAQNTFPLPSGNVGIGTTTPSVLLEVAGSFRLSSQDGITFNTGLTTYNWKLGANMTVNNGFEITSSTSAGGLTFDTPAVVVRPSGNVGIGTTSPQAPLHVASGGGGRILLQSDSTRYNFLIGQQVNVPNGLEITPSTLPGGFAFASPAMVVLANGRVGVGTTSPAQMLHVIGDAQIDGNIAAKYQDVAEWVPVLGSLSAGSVVVIDGETRNRVLVASRAYDTRVAGVVSARPGILLGEAGEDKAKVAQSGRVKVRVDAQYGPIAVGDLLVTSQTPGYAMRSEPVSLGSVSLHRPGTILGKALESLETGRGEILVLLTLQ